MQRLGTVTLLLAVILLFTLAFPAAAAGPNPPMPTPPHPHIVAALEHMNNAKGHLKQAEGEFSGHRARAIELLDQAIHEAQMCVDAPK